MSLSVLVLSNIPSPSKDTGVLYVRPVAVQWHTAGDIDYTKVYVGDDNVYWQFTGHTEIIPGKTYRIDYTYSGNVYGHYTIVTIRTV